jgi:hypothetical protein
MGLGSSKEPKNKMGVKHYRPPGVRQKDRFDPLENANFANQNDSSIDKFDYLIVFPLTEGEKKDTKE